MAPAGWAEPEQPALLRGRTQRQDSREGCGLGLTPNWGCCLKSQHPSFIPQLEAGTEGNAGHPVGGPSLEGASDPILRAGWAGNGPTWPL